MKNTFLLLLLVTVGACRSSLSPATSFHAFENMRWLTGYWQSENACGLLLETWTFHTDTLAHRICYATDPEGGVRPVNAGFITVDNGRIVYVNDPVQGEERLIWELADCSAQRLRFYNGRARRDQDIVLEHTADDRLRLVLTSDGQAREFFFSRGGEDLTCVE